MRRRLITLTALGLVLAACTAIPKTMGSPSMISARVKNCHALKSCPTTSQGPTTSAATTTTAAPTTSTIPVTTTTQPTTTTTLPTDGVPNQELAATYAGGFLSYPHQSGRQSVSGNNLVVAQRSYVGFTGGACLTISNAVNVYVHDIDFDTCGGGLFLINVSGTVRVENIRCRNIGNGSIGSGQGNCTQFNNTWQDAPEIVGGYARIVHVKAYGGNTEDVISIFQSGGRDATHPLVIGDVHVEHPLPPSSLAWSSTTGTCVNLADAGGHDIRLQNSTFLNCGQVGIQMNEPTARVKAVSNKVYGAARTASNVGLSQWADNSCPSCSGNNYTNNQVFWLKENGAASPWWSSNTYPVTFDATSKTQDPATPQTHVVL